MDFAVLLLDPFWIRESHAKVMTDLSALSGLAGWVIVACGAGNGELFARRAPIISLSTILSCRLPPRRESSAGFRLPTLQLRAKHARRPVDFDSCDGSIRVVARGFIWRMCGRVESAEPEYPDKGRRAAVVERLGGGLEASGQRE